MVNKIDLFPILSVLIISGCVPGDRNWQVQGTSAQSVDWSEKSILLQSSACELSFKETNPAYLGEAAKPYCECVFKEISSRWKYAEFQVSAESIVGILAKEGIIEECQIEGITQAGHQAGRDIAKASVSQDATVAGMPDGLMGVKLLASTSDLRAIRPNVQKTELGWAEVVEWNGAPFRAFYKFDENEEAVILILLLRQSNKGSYRKIQSQLNEDFGPFPDPSPLGEMLLQSRKSSGGVSLDHNLVQGPDGMMVEQVMLYRERKIK